jgi:hypothetical protein
LAPRLGLKPGEVVADRRLRVLQLTGGGSHRAVAGDREQDAQPRDIEHGA